MHSPSHKRAAGADAFDMMVMAFLGQADFILEPEDLGAVFAQAAVHGVVAVDDLLDALLERFHDHGVIVQVGGLDEFDLRDDRRRLVPCADRCG